MHVDPSQGIVRTGILAGGSGYLIDTQITFGGFDDWLAGFLISEEVTFLVANLDHADVLIGAAVRAGSATDTRVVVDDDLPTFGVAMDRAGRAADHAYRIRAVHARVGHHEMTDTWSMTNEPGVIVVGRGAASYAIVTTRTTVEVDHHGCGAIDESSLNQLLQKIGGRGIVAGAARNEVELFFVALEH